MTCRVCGEATAFAFSGRILGKHDVAYHRCPRCEFLQTDEPFWLDEAYSSAISDLDLGPVNRAVTGARIVEGVIALGFDPNGRFIDWGGGYGVFTRLMRDKGYDFFWRDPYCENLFSKHFVADEGGRYELMTAFEVFEHLVQPMAEIEMMLRWAPSILFTTEVPPPGLKAQADWWYLTPEHGQHVAFYSVRTLRFIAERFGVHLATNGSALHLLSRRRVSDRLFQSVAHDRRAAQLIRGVGRRRLRTPSRLMDDFRAVTGWRA